MNDYLKLLAPGFLLIYWCFSVAAILDQVFVVKEIFDLKGANLVIQRWK